MKRILIVLVEGIGDLVLASRAMRAIKKGSPHAEIHLLTSIESAPIALHYDIINRVWPFHIRELRKSKGYLLYMMKAAIMLRKMNFDEVINIYRVSSRIGAFKM